MGVKRLLTIMTAFLVGAMLFDGLYQPDAPLMWLASTTIPFAYMRVALVIVLIMLVVTSPPRSQNSRIFLMGFAGALFIGTMLLAAGYAIGLLDAIIFIEVAIIFMIEALETNPVRVHKLGYNYKLAKKK